MKTFLAVYLGTPDSAARAAWDALPAAEREARQQRGIEAWHAWMERHADVVVDAGGPLGRTKRVDAGGVADGRNALTGYVVVRAPSHEAAAKLFEDHPHFAVFPGEAVEIMECLPIPGA
jgi:hypothetical protein